MSAKPKITNRIKAARLRFLQKLPLIENEARALGLNGTRRALNLAVQISGYEVAGDVVQVSDLMRRSP